MDDKVCDTLPLIEWGVAAQALAGQAESGDQCLVKPLPNGVLVAVVDGLGHGNKAAAVAKTAIATLERHAHESVISLLKCCHKELLGTRGVVMSLASLNALKGTMTWLGVGNVKGLLLRADAGASPAHGSLLLHGGVVGYRLPSLRAAVVPVTRGDTLLFATDGIRSGFTEGLIRSDSPLRPLDTLGTIQAQDGAQQIADRIFAQHSRGTDDALVLVVRYVGGVP